MTVAECYKYVQEGVNKLQSNSSQNIPETTFVTTFNAVQLQWVEDRIKLNEVNNVRIDEIQQILLQVDLKVKKENLFYSSDLPSNYFHYRRSYSTSGECVIFNHLKEEGNVNILLQDEFWKPSKEWAETFCTLVGNKLRIYHNNEVDISKAHLIYYRYPVNINMGDGFSDVNGVTTTDVDPEFQGSSLIEILNLTIQHLAGVINDTNRYQVFSNKVQVHT